MIETATETVGTLLARAADHLRAADVENARREALLLLAHALSSSTAELLAHPDRPVAAAEQERFSELVRRRAGREPFAYLVGQREFYGLTFAVDRRVLVPRPETEILVDEARSALATIGGRGERRPTVVDVGTGSGAIACSIAAHAVEAGVVAADLSVDALRVADLNRRRLGLANRVRLVRGDLLGWLGEPVDVVVANLPYVPSTRLPTLMPEVSRFEPPIALDGGPDGAALIHRLLAQARRSLRPGGTLLLELDPEQVVVVRRRAPWGETRVIADLAGLPRVIRVDLP